VADHLPWGNMSSVIQAVIIIAIPVTAVLRAWISYRQVIIIEKARTRRLNRALEGVGPDQRSKIIVACSQLETNSSSKVRYGKIHEGRTSESKPWNKVES
jgi:hypothetical protein